MAEQYRQTLISRDKRYVPSPSAVHKFLTEMVAKRVVPDRPSLLLRTRTGKTQEYPNPFTGGKVIVEVKELTRLANLDEFEEAAAGLSDYEVAVHGEGRPRLPPLSIEFDDRYFVGVTCYVCSVLRSTSDSHEEAKDNRRVPFYGELFASLDMTGVFCDPKSGQQIDIPDAGAARFWIEFELGKLLFPEIVDGKLEVLNPEIVMAAEECFGVPFVEGCFWG